MFGRAAIRLGIGPHSSFIKICNVNVDFGLDSDLKSVDLDLGCLVPTTLLVLFVFVCSLRRYVFMKVLLLIQRTTCRNLIGKPPSCLRYSLFVFYGCPME